MTRPPPTATPLDQRMETARRHLWKRGAAWAPTGLAKPPPKPAQPLPPQSLVSNPCEGSGVLAKVRRQKVTSVKTKLSSFLFEK